MSSLHPIPDTVLGREPDVSTVVMLAAVAPGQKPADGTLVGRPQRRKSAHAATVVKICNIFDLYPSLCYSTDVLKEVGGAQGRPTS